MLLIFSGATSLSWIPHSYCPSFYQNYASLTSKLRHPEEFLTAKWCLDYIPLTQQQQSENLCVIHYEDLVNLGVDHFKAAFTFLGLSFDNSLEDLVNRPSFTTQKGSNVLQGKNPLSTYRSHLNNEQIGRIEDTLSSFGLSDWRSSLSHHEILSAWSIRRDKTLCLLKRARQQERPLSSASVSIAGAMIYWPL